MVVVSTALVSELDKPGCLYSQGMLIGMAAIGLVFAIWIKEDLKRLKYEKSIAFEGDQKPLLTENTASKILSCEQTSNLHSDESQVDSNRYIYTTESK